MNEETALDSETTTTEAPPAAPDPVLCPSCFEHFFTSVENKICGPCRALVDAVSNGATHLLRDPLVNDLYKRATDIAGEPAVKVAETMVEEAVPGLREAVQMFQALKAEIEPLISTMRDIIAEHEAAVTAKAAVEPFPTFAPPPAPTGPSEAVGNAGAVPPLPGDEIPAPVTTEPVAAPDESDAAAVTEPPVAS